jgi:membrane-associated phospholipid phosphatase
MKVWHSPAPVEADARRISGTSLRLLTLYIAVTTLPVLNGAMGEGDWLPVVLHAAAFGVVLFALHPAAPAAVRAWTPLALGPWLYVELRWIIAGAGRAHADSLIMRWDDALGSHSPWHVVASPVDSLLVSELLHLCYLSYYALIYVPAALLWLRGQRAAFAETTLALMIVYGLCFVTYIAFPVDGPRFLAGPAAAPDGPIRRMVLGILEAGSSRGTAFPSAHMAASLVASWQALRFQRPVGVVALALTIGLAFGAVYGGYHYAIDIVAGVVYAGVALLIMRRGMEPASARP